MFEYQSEAWAKKRPAVRRSIPVCGIVVEDIFLAGDELHQVLEIKSDERYPDYFDLRVLSEKRQSDWPICNEVGRWITLCARDELDVFVGAKLVWRVAS